VSTIEVFVFNFLPWAC